MNKLTYPTQTDGGIQSSTPQSVVKRRPAGRPRGSKNKATLAREAALRLAEKEAAASLPPETIQGLSALEIMEFSARWHFARGHFSVAAEIAARVAPYRHARLSAPVELGPTKEAQLSAAQMIAADPDPEHDPRGSAVNTRQCTGPHAPAAQGGS